MWNAGVGDEWKVKFDGNVWFEGILRVREGEKERERELFFGIFVNGWVEDWKVVYERRVIYEMEFPGTIVRNVYSVVVNVLGGI